MPYFNYEKLRNSKPWWKPLKCWKVDTAPIQYETKSMNALGQPRTTSQKVFISASVQTNLNSLLKVYIFWYWFSIAASPNCNMAVFQWYVGIHIHVCVRLHVLDSFKIIEQINCYTKLRGFYYYDLLFS